MNQSIAAGGVRRPEIVLRQPYWAVIELVLGAGLAVTHFLATSSGSFWWDVTGGGAIGALVSMVYMLAYRYEVQSGRITVRDLWSRRRSVDLTRLTTVTAPPRPETFLQRKAGWRRFLVLEDEQGLQVKLNFSGTQRGPRRQLLTAIEPYVLAGGVSRTGLVREALDGQLWWPRPRLRS
jgi:hypothetical protein